MRDSNSKYALRGEIREICDLRIYVKALSKDCDLKNARIAVLEEEIYDLREHNEALSGAHTKITKENIQLTDNLHKALTRNANLRVKIKQLTRELDSCLHYPEKSISAILGMVRSELLRASEMHPAMRSLHEAHGVILEEFEEFWEEAKKKTGSQDENLIKKELIQTAAMCVRAILDILNKGAWSE